MKTKRTDREIIKSKVVGIKMSPEEKDKYQKFADKIGITFSGLIRLSINKFMEQWKND